MKICFSGSIKYKDEIIRISEKFRELGIFYYLPEMDIPKESETLEMIPRLVYDHFLKIEESEAIFVVNPNGYVGNSVKVEIGYAKGCGKKVYFMEATGQPELDCLVDKIIPFEDLESLR